MIRVRIGVAVVLCGVLLISACGGEADKTSQLQETPAGTSTQAVTPESEGTPATPPTPCEIDRDAIQIALNDYHLANGHWPTADSQPGDIVWDKLVPDFLGEVPPTDEDCEWQINSDPEGEVCLLTPC
ncbi:MAG: hypothetical protein SVM79_03565 [Chloroflexota bacterium]|nr:hypothetical protein [Chloroflexota bacterium]